MIGAGPALPLWALIPPAFLFMLVLAASIKAMQQAEMPESRRRIRTSASLIMMALMPLLVYLFGIGSAQSPRPFIFTWALVMGLLAILVILAMMDAINNTRIATRRRVELRRELRALRRDLDELSRANEEPQRHTPSLRLTGDDASRDRSDGAG